MLDHLELFLLTIDFDTQLHGTFAQKFKEKASKLYMDMAAFMKSKTMSAPGTLKEYSPWMADFQGMDYQEQLEIPGTFLNLFRPADV